MSDASELIAQQILNASINKKSYGTILYNVKSFGAVGDFDTTTKLGTDDTQSINDTIGVAIANGGGVIFFPFSTGAYRITSEIFLASTVNNVTFAGEGTVYLHYTADQPLFEVRGTNIKFEGLTFRSDSTYTRRNIASFIYLNGASDVYISGCRFYDSPSTAVYMDNEANNVIVSNNMVYDSKADGIHMTNGSYDVVVEGNKLYNTGDDSISVVWYSGDVHSQPTNIVIDGNLTVDSQAAGVTICHAKNVSITGNQIINCLKSAVQLYPGGLRAEYTEDVSVIGNTLKNVGDGLTDHGFYMHQVKDVIIQDNNLDGSQDSAVLFGEFDNLKIKGNIFKAPKNYGIANITTDSLATTNKLFIEDNTFDSVEKTSILISPMVGNNYGNVFIAENKIFNNDTSATSSNYIDVDRCNVLRVIGNRNYDNTDTILLGTNNTNVETGDNYPQAWQTYTPTIGATSGTITTSSAAGYYERKGNTVHFLVSITITTNGTGSGLLTCSLPIPFISGKNAVFVGREDGISGVMLQGILASGVIRIAKTDNSYPGVDGAVIKLSGTYEIA